MTRAAPPGVFPRAPLCGPIDCDDQHLVGLRFSSLSQAISIQDSPRPMEPHLYANLLPTICCHGDYRGQNLGDQRSDHRGDHPCHPWLELAGIASGKDVLQHGKFYPKDQSTSVSPRCGNPRSFAKHPCLCLFLSNFPCRCYLVTKACLHKEQNICQCLPTQLRFHETKPVIAQLCFPRVSMSS